MNKTAIYALTPQGARLGKILADKLSGDLFLSRHSAGLCEAACFDRLHDAVSENLLKYPRHVFIAAVGIVVRVIAPHLRSKRDDPAIVVLDQKGRHAISLVSGHLGGANALAHEVARLTGGEAVITTATDTEGVPSMDMFAEKRGLFIANVNAVKGVNMAVLEGRPVQVFDPEDRLGLKNREIPGLIVDRVENKEDWNLSEPGVWVTWRLETAGPGENRLILHPGSLVAGIGCNKGTSGTEILNLVLTTFKDNSLSLESLKCIATIEAKRDEKGLIEAADKLKVPLLFVDPSEIESIRVPNPSFMVEKHMGVASVCEATAILISRKGRLLVPKTKSLNVTLAVALGG
ncbi:MAG: cobalamin biosynthesis protein [Desulfatiglans sp.]|jgi:cobalt-precorrin 5A hydrolase|nr:cobalamin biosynthesis protein [Desulfatiglans sp.]